MSLSFCLLKRVLGGDGGIDSLHFLPLFNLGFYDGFVLRAGNFLIDFLLYFC